MPSVLMYILSWVLAGALARVIAGAGLAIGSYSILSDMLDDFLSFVTSSLDNLAGDFAAILWIAGVGEALSIVGSALVAVAAINSARVFLGLPS